VALPASPHCLADRQPCVGMLVVVLVLAAFGYLAAWVWGLKAGVGAL
jgi:hypothetical protein